MGDGLDHLAGQELDIVGVLLGGRGDLVDAGRGLYRTCRDLVEVGQALGKHLRGEAVDPVLELAEAQRRPLEQVMDQDEVSFPTEQVLHRHQQRAVGHRPGLGIVGFQRWRATVACPRTHQVLRGTATL